MEIFISIAVSKGSTFQKDNRLALYENVLFIGKNTKKSSFQLL